jgi:hypothetical protein
MEHQHTELEIVRAALNQTEAANETSGRSWA